MEYNNYYYYYLVSINDLKLKKKMKFAEHLSAHITPEWRQAYINYEVCICCMLKIWLKKWAEEKTQKNMHLVFFTLLLYSSHLICHLSHEILIIPHCIELNYHFIHFQFGCSLFFFVCLHSYLSLYCLNKHLLMSIQLNSLLLMCFKLKHSIN